MASPEVVAPRRGRGFPKYLGFGRAENEEVRPGRLAMVSHGLPGYLARFYTVGSGAFCRMALELAGAREVRVFLGRAHAPRRPRSHQGAHPHPLELSGLAC